MARQQDIFRPPRKNHGSLYRRHALQITHRQTSSRLPSSGFEILRRCNMKLNPTKCSFGVSAGKFLGYLVTQRGIEANPEQIWSVLSIPSPTHIKDV